MIAAAISAGVGLLDRRWPRASTSRELKPRDGFLLVTLSWVLMSASATIPLLLALPELSFTRRLLRDDVRPDDHRLHGARRASTICRRRINLWRHALHWFGGLGIIVLAVAILPLLGVGGMQLYKAETPGPGEGREAHAAHHRDGEVAVGRLHAASRSSASSRCASCGMSWFDAICHAFSALSLGGFSTHDASVGYFNSRADRARADAC